MTVMMDRQGLEEAIAQAKLALSSGQLPVGCVIKDRQGVTISSAHNRARELDDRSAHAELLAIREVMAAVGSQDVSEMSVYVTLEPCPMCLSALVLCRFGRVVWASRDDKLIGSRIFEEIPYGEKYSLERVATPFPDLEGIAADLYREGKRANRTV